MDSSQLELDSSQLFYLKLIKVYHLIFFHIGWHIYCVFEFIANKQNHFYCLSVHPTSRKIMDQFGRRQSVSPVFQLRWSLILSFIIFSSLVIQVFPITFVFNGFNGTNLILKANSSVIRSKSVLALTNHTHFRVGRALYSTPLQMKRNETLSSFSTTFVFCMVCSRSDAGGEGMAFILTPYTSPTGALSAGYLGLVNGTSNGQPYNHLLAVEFDSITSVQFYDPDNNHVGLDINSLTSVQTETAGYWNEEDFQPFSLKSGRNIQAWIDYDHLQSRLNVTITLAGLPRPQKPLISQTIDLQNVLQEQMFAGFSASTGNFGEDHYVLAWSFTTQGTPHPLDMSRLPSFVQHSKNSGRGLIAGVTVATLGFFSLVMVAAVFLKRAKHRETIEEFTHTPANAKSTSRRKSWIR